MDHQATHHEEIIQYGAPLVLKEAVDTQTAKPGNSNVGGSPKEIDSDDEQDGVEDTRDEYPFPQAVGPDEVVSFCIGLEGNYDFF